VFWKKAEKRSTFLGPEKSGQKKAMKYDPPKKSMKCGTGKTASSKPTNTKNFH
jgi:hypothetical protein